METAGLLTDAQLAAVLAALVSCAVGMGKLVQWAVKQWLADRKEDRDERRVDRDADRAATAAVATAMTTMSLKFEYFERSLGRVAQVVEDEISGVHRAAPSVRAQTEPMHRADPYEERRMEREGQRAKTPAPGVHGPRRPRQDT